MVGIGEYAEFTEDPDVNQYRLNTGYNSIVRYYKDLVSGKLLSVVPYDIVMSKNIISCKYIDENGNEIFLIASIKNGNYDRTSIQQKGDKKGRP